MSNDSKKSIPFRVNSKQKQALLDCAKDEQLSVQKLLERIVFPYLQKYLPHHKEGAQ